MKKHFLIKFFTLTLAMFLSASAAFEASADVNFPYSNPTYIPTLTNPSAVLPTGAQNIVISTAGASTLAFNFTGTCTSLAATVNGSLDNGVTYTQLNFYPYPALGTAAPTIDADGTLAASAGVVKVNSAGFNKIKIAISALAGATCTFTAAETQGSFNGTTF
jgi:uncharacterized Fe-S center protein